MTRSMTAFARQAATHPWGTLTWELKTVNHRYLDLSWKMPEAARGAEGDLRELARKHLSRGKLDAQLSLEWRLDQDELAVNETLAKQVAGAAERIAAQLNNPAPLDPLRILTYPGVVEPPVADSTAVHQAVTALFEQALLELNRARAREGEALKQLIEQRLDGVRAEVAKVRDRLPQVQQALREKLQARLAQFVAQPDPERLEQEMVYLAQKSDVAEELDRLAAHDAEVRRALNGGGSVGRRLDFLMQEFNREANTLASKATDSQVTQAAVELKVLIEQMREQIQNIE